MAGRRPSSSRRGRFATFVADVRAEAGQFRRLFRYSRPYRVMLVASWIATAGYAAAGAGIVNMVQLYKQQAAKAGIQVNVITGPASEYWDNVWLKQPFQVSAWSARPGPGSSR